MSYMRIIAISQDSCIGNGGWDQIFGPVYTCVRIFLLLNKVKQSTFILLNKS